MPLVVTCRPSPVPTGCRAPLATRVLADEVEHATGSEARPQIVARVAGEEVDRLLVARGQESRADVSPRAGRAAGSARRPLQARPMRCGGRGTVDDLDG